MCLSIPLLARSEFMKRYVLSFAGALEHIPKHPERTAKRHLSFDVEFQIWSNRAAMAKSIRMQQRGEHRPDHWRACVPLSDGEGY
jgi:hypothetical protein